MAVSVRELWCAHQDGDNVPSFRERNTTEVSSREESSALRLALDAEARDRTLLDRIQTGDPEALAMLARLHGETLTRVARSVLHDTAQADDVVQEVLFSLWERRAMLNVEKGIAGYLYRAVRYRAIAVNRAERSIARTSQHAITDPSELPRVANTALDNLADEELLSLVHRVLAGVAPQCREVFLLSWHAGLSYAEIAEQLGIAIRTVYNQMHRAVKALGQAIPELMDG